MLPAEGMLKTMPFTLNEVRCTNSVALLQKLRRLSTHLNNCMDSTPDKFTSWRALCTYLAIIPSFRDAATLKVAEPNIRILEFLKPTWKTAAVFEVPVEVLNVCLRACSIRRIEWLQSSALKCVIDIAISVVHRSTKHERLKEVAQRPGCLSLTSLSCNQYASQLCSAALTC